MNANDIKNFKQKVCKRIGQRRLKEAFSEIKDMAKKRMAWEITDKLEKAEENYAYMLKYMSDGVVDPERDVIYNGIVTDLYDILDSLVLLMEKQENASLYFSTLRLYDRASMDGRITALIKRCINARNRLDFFEEHETEAPSADHVQARKDMERTQAELFTGIWIAPKMSSADAESLRTLLAGDKVDADFKTYVISSLMLGAMQIFDEKRICLLIDAYLTLPDAKPKAAAMVALVLTLWTHASRPLPKAAAARLEAAKDTDAWKTDLQDVFIELIRARYTESIDKKVRDEIIPEMMKIRGDLMDKINDGQMNVIDLSSPQENPEWQELLDKSGVTDKMKELTEMKAEGFDLMMSTFSNLKRFPFFSSIPNWFLPFDPKHSMVTPNIGYIGQSVGIFTETNSFCDSDKYSFIFALEMLPQAQRELMTGQFGAQADAFAEQTAESNLTQHISFVNAANIYIQNIYRFFKLSNRKDEFVDPFASILNLLAVPMLAKDFDDPEILQVIAEFYFKIGYMSEAFDAFVRLSELQPADGLLYQKMGYCSEKLGDLRKALLYYQRAELFDARSKWIRKRLAATYRALGEYDNAIKYYRGLAEDNPSSVSTALLLGYAYTENGNYDQAIKQFAKAEYLDEKSHKAWRPLAWTLFLTGDFDGAKKYYDKVMSATTPTATDYLNMGHVAVAASDFRNAINYYKLYAQQKGNSFDSLIKAIEADQKYLDKAGANTNSLHLILDAVAYEL